jgi:signal recognition particle subunit SRP54
MDALETFEPERLASRILGMGDMISLIEKAESVYQQEQAEEQVGKLLSGGFTLEDFADQLTQMQRMGPMNKILELLPSGFGGVASQIDGQAAEKQMLRSRAIIQSMTPQERRKPELLNGRRRRRIAAGSGTTVQEVNQLLRSYKQMKKMFKLVGKKGLKGLPPGIRLP